MGGVFAAGFLVDGASAGGSGSATRPPHAMTSPEPSATRTAAARARTSGDVGSEKRDERFMLGPFERTQNKCKGVLTPSVYGALGVGTIRMIRIRLS